MKKRSLSIGGRPGPLTHAAQSKFSPLVSIPRCDIAPRQIESQRVDITQLSDHCGLQQESQSNHPFLARSGQPHSSQSQRLSVSPGCLTQSQSTQQFSQNSQPEDYGCDPWNRPGFLDKEISLSQPKQPSPYFAGLTSSLNRRNVSGTVGGGSTPASSSGTSSALFLVGPQSSTPRPWPQCNVSEELEKRLGSLEKLREEDAVLLEKICDDYQQIKILLEETCFEGKDNRSKLALQQNTLHKLLKEEETANSSILTAIKTSGEAILQEIRNLKKSAEEADVAKDNIVLADFEHMIESFREEVVSFKKDLKAELDAMKQSVRITDTQPQLPNRAVPITDAHHELLPNQSSHTRMDITESIPTQSLGRSSVPISMSEVVDLDEIPDFESDMHHQPLLMNQSSHTRMDITESIPTQSLGRSSVPILMPEVVDLDEIPDFDLDTGLLVMARAAAISSTRSRAKKKKSINISDEDIQKRDQGMVLRVLRRVCYEDMC